MTARPWGLVKLTRLRELSADNNQIVSLRMDLRECTELRVISLEGNRLTKPVLDMRALAKVGRCRLKPLETLVESAWFQPLKLKCD